MLSVHRTTAENLIDDYEEQRKEFMGSTTFNDFMGMFPASAVSNELSAKKNYLKVKLQRGWGTRTLHDLDMLTQQFVNDADFHDRLHLSHVIEGCLEVYLYISHFVEPPAGLQQARLPEEISCVIYQ